jgi:hypothetical protein
MWYGKICVWKKNPLAYDKETLNVKKMSWSLVEKNMVCNPVNGIIVFVFVFFWNTS